MSSASSPAATVTNPVVLVSIDGWGYSPHPKGNAILNANTPVMRELSQQPLHIHINASGLAVGLPEGVMGNSEVGHLTMGCGRVEFQDLVRINLALSDGSFASNPRLVAHLAHCKQTTGRLHLLGLVSDGGVHSHIQHLFAFLAAAKAAGIPHCYVHFFADGRDTPPTSAVQYLTQLSDHIAATAYGSIATVIGRYYAMDRDKRWERIQVAYDALLAGKGERVPLQSLPGFIQSERYAKDQKDEFLTPIIVDGDGVIRDNDSLIFFNYRSDRMREINSLWSAEPLPFESAASVDRHSLSVAIMTQYDERAKLPILFPPQTNVNCLSEWLSSRGLRQFHTAETEKYAHVTFFFNGGREQPFEREDRQLVPSPKVRTYDLQPTMSQQAVCDAVVQQGIAPGHYQFVMCNFAAPDMVGHTGQYAAAVTAVEDCDAQIGRIREACAQHGYTLIVTADHGNAEEMEDENGAPKTSHTSNVIPMMVVPKAEVAVEWREDIEKARQEGKAVGGLSDVAPTVLTLMGLEIPKEMTGKSLIKPLKK